MILFITRKYPPSVGGMQKFSYDFAVNMNKFRNVYTISWNRSNLTLLFFVIYALFYSAYIIKTRNIRLVHLGDGLLSPLGVLLKFIHPVIITITVHGLDVTLPNRIYQFIIPKCLTKLDKIICVSNETKKECINRKILGNKIVVIPNGINREEFYLSESKQNLVRILSTKLNMNLENKKILLSVGRLIERKGFQWFSKEVVPKLLEKRGGDILYLIVGEGPFKWKIKEIIKTKNLEDHVYLLGKVDDKTLKLLYHASDLFVMPNIHVEGDMEGFGIVALEATSCELTVVASNLEGIKDAIIEGENGFLVEPYDADGYVAVILRLLEDDEKREEFGKKAGEFTHQQYNWCVISERYDNEFEKVLLGE